MKRIIGLLLSVCMLMSMAATVSAKDTIFYDGEMKAYFNGEFVDILNGEGVVPTIKDGTFYVPIRAFVELNNGNIVWKKTGEKISADFAIGSYYTLESNSDTIVKYNGDSEALSKEVFLNENYNRLMVPADTFEKMGYKLLQGDDYLGIYSISNEDNKIVVNSDIENSALASVELSYSLLNDIGEVFVANIQDMGGIISQTVGRVGYPIEINVVGGAVNNAEITFNYNESQLGGVKESDLKIAWYNELEGRMELLESSMADVQNNKVTVKTSHFSQYILVDSAAWYEAWAKTQLIVRSSENPNGFFNVVFLLDDSGSMRSSVSLLKSAAVEFINELYPEDLVSFVTFSDGTKTFLSQKYKKDISEQEINSLVNELKASGGTDMATGFEEAKNYFVPNPYLHSGEYRSIMVLLSDGQPAGGESVTDEMLEDAKELDVKILSLALGSGSDVTLMQNIAEKTEGVYKYINSAEDLQSVFEMLRGEIIGLDTDSDGDGIPDLIETSGMRDQAGNIFITDPNDADTDGDGYSDGEEMGVFVDNSQTSYFKRKSDPKLSTSYTDRAEVIVSNPSTESINDEKFKVNCNLKVLERKADHLSEIIYSDAKGATLTVNAPDCIDYNLNVSVEDKSYSGMTNTANNDVYIGDLTPYPYGFSMAFECMQGGISCKNKHKIQLNFKGENFDEKSIETSIDFKEIIINSILKDIEQIQKKINDRTKQRLTNYVTKYHQDADNVDILEEIKITAVSSAGIEIPDDNERAIKQIIIQMLAEKNGLEKINYEPAKMVADSWALLGYIGERAYSVDIDGQNYVVTIKGYIPKIGANAIANLDGTCKNVADGKEYDFHYSSSQSDMQLFAKAYDEILDKLRADTGKELIKEILKSWSMTSLINQAEADLLNKIGIYNDVQAFKMGYDLYNDLNDLKITIGAGGANDTLNKKMDAYGKATMESNLLTDGVYDLAFHVLEKFKLIK